MHFVDEVRITARAGKGGAGASHFRREKFVPRGGPDGGDGGHGGSIVLRGSLSKHTLLDLQLKPLWAAPNGEPGGTAGKTGADGSDTVIDVPLGTEVYDAASNEFLGELVEAGATLVAAQGGKGGKGNRYFKSSTNRAPTYAQPGLPGAERELLLSLKLMADVGLVGFPNAGKSTLLARLSAARPKIADYPFTTLIPQLGVVSVGDGRTFVLADIPGLIEGASEGRGLGIQFLKHLSRVRVLLILLDLTQSQALEEDAATSEDSNERFLPLVEQLRTLERELENFSPEVASRTRLVALSKVDCFSDDTLDEATRFLQDQGVDVCSFSSQTGKGLTALQEKIWAILHPSASPA